MARLGPTVEEGVPSVDVDRATLERILEMPLDAEAMEADLGSAEPPIELDRDPWTAG